MRACRGLALFKFACAWCVYACCCQFLLVSCLCVSLVRIRAHDKWTAKTVALLFLSVGHLMHHHPTTHPPHHDSRQRQAQVLLPVAGLLPPGPCHLCFLHNDRQDRLSDWCPSHSEKQPGAARPSGLAAKPRIEKLSRALPPGLTARPRCRCTALPSVGPRAWGLPDPGLRASGRCGVLGASGLGVAARKGQKGLGVAVDPRHAVATDRTAKTAMVDVGAGGGGGWSPGGGGGWSPSWRRIPGRRRWRLS